MNKKIMIPRTFLVGGFLAGIWITGCTSDPVDPAPTETEGQVSFELQIAPGIALDAVDYTIAGTAGFSRKGTIEVTNSSTVSAVISRIPFGVGYQITLRGTSADGGAACTGAAAFDVDRPGVRPVAVHMTCELAPATGSVLINGTLNACPRIDGIDASPAEVAVGGSIRLQVAAVDVDHAPAALAYGWATTSGTLDAASAPSATLTCTRVGLVTVTVGASDGDPACSSSRSVDLVCSEPAPRTPIKHVIVLIGENRTFDHTFGTYRPRPGQTISNLVSKGIVNPDGTPGPSFALAAQAEAAPQSAYYIAPDAKTPYTILPGPSTSGAPTAQRATAPPFQTIDQAQFETDLDPADLALLTTGATGLPARVLDTRVTNAGSLPNGPFQLTGPAMPYDAYTGDSIHRFYQMWQQVDCSAARATASNPSGCANDLFPFVAISFSGNDNGVGSSMAFFNVDRGDAPFLKMLADSYAMSDNMHQAVQGGTGANHSMLGFADAVAWTDGLGNPAVPPATLIANPNPRAGTNNRYTVDGNFSNCSDATAPGIAPITSYLSSLPYHPGPNCAPGTYYYLNNTNPAYNPSGTLKTTGTFVPPTIQRSIGDALGDKGISWRFYGGGFNRGTGYCQICNPFEYQTQVMADAAARAEHIRDTVDLFADIANGTLPAVSFAHPDGALDGHPSSSKLGLFEAYVKNILARLDANPALKASTAVIVTFDEGGGYYDSGFIQPIDFFGDGPRIPLIIVSPFTRGGTINHSYADHVSILKFIERNWALSPITGRSRDNLPNPVATADNPYVPTNMPALSDLFDMFDFNQ
ncbi:MAG TPA: alkaline phosphatase family protein [Kofleriaceae bacterium]|nr:alkaline phosphatase family protein [Kofleriaceae bacterium]